MNRFACLLVLGFLGSVAIAEESRDVKAERGEVLAISELDRRRAENHRELQAIEAEAFAFVAEIASHHALGPTDKIVGFDPVKGTFHVVTAVAPVVSAEPAPVASSK